LYRFWISTNRNRARFIWFREGPSPELLAAATAAKTVDLVFLSLEGINGEFSELLLQDCRSSLLVFEGVNGEFSELLLQDSRSSPLLFKDDNGEFSCVRKLDKRISPGGQAVCSSGVRSTRCLQDRGRLVSWMKQSLRVGDLSSTSTPTPGPTLFLFLKCFLKGFFRV
jgi:hypothetical protein